MRIRILLVMVAIFLMVGIDAGIAKPAAASPPGQERREMPKEDRARGKIYRGLQLGRAGSTCAGMFEIVGNGGCTHGPDAAPDGVDVAQERPVEELTAATEETAMATAPSVACYGDGTTGNRVHAVYAVASDRPDRFASLEASMRTWAAAADQVFDKSAAKTGGARRVRFVTNPDCTLAVAKVVLSPAGDDSLSNMMSEMKAKGFNVLSRKYLVWADATVYCGIGHMFGDDKPTADNYNNSGRAMYARVDSGCWGRPNSVEAHEVMHTLGGVQSTAPHATGAAHCTDESDRMCYDDGGVTLTYPCASTQEALFDCGNDDYFHVNPPAGSYLATHWNVARNAFLEPGPSTTGLPTDSTPPPTPTGLAATPGNGQVSLFWNAVTALDLAGYRVYRDGVLTTSVPSPAHVASGLVNGTNHSFAVSAVDVAGNESPRSAALSASALAVTYLSVNDVTINEGAAGTTIATFTVTRTGVTTGASSVKYKTGNGTALSGSDYTAKALTTLSFAPGETSKPATVAITGDSVYEDHETFTVTLSGVTGATLSDATGKATIVNDDAVSYFDITDAVVTEGNAGTSTAGFTVARSGNLAGTATVSYRTNNGTAIAGSDYTAVALTPLSFAPGESAKAVTVAVTGETLDEVNESFTVGLYSAVGAVVSDTTGTGTVVDDDGAVTAGPTTFLRVDDVSVTEGHTATRLASFTVRRSGTTSGASTVQLTTRNGTATAGSDFTGVGPTTVSFAAGETTKSVAVPVAGDSATELAESFSVVMSAASGATLSDSTGIGRIVDDDAAYLSIGDINVAEGSTGTTTATFTITRTGATAGAATVSYTTNNGSAAAGSDYAPVAPTKVAFATGETSKTVAVPVLHDVVDEPGETFTVTLSAASGGAIIDTSGAATIIDND